MIRFHFVVFFIQNVLALEIVNLIIYEFKNCTILLERPFTSSFVVFLLIFSSSNFCILHAVQKMSSRVVFVDGNL